MLVHCVQGLSRSATVVAAYCKPQCPYAKHCLIHIHHVVMYSRRIGASEAMEMVRRGI